MIKYNKTLMALFKPKTGGPNFISVGITEEIKKEFANLPVGTKLLVKVKPDSTWRGADAYLEILPPREMPKEEDFDV